MLPDRRVTWFRRQESASGGVRHGQRDEFAILGREAEIRLTGPAPYGAGNRRELQPWAFLHGLCLV